jgi:hypothetical protein
MKMTVFCHVTPCSQAELDRDADNLKMNAICTSETLVKFHLGMSFDIDKSI